MSLRFKGLAELEKDYRRAASKTARAEVSAVRRAGTTVRARQARAVRAMVNIKVGEIKKAIKVIKKPTADKPAITFEVREKGVPLMHYAAKQLKRGGVSVKVLRSGGRKKLSARGDGGTPFIADGAGGGSRRQVFARTGGAKRAMKSGRYAGKMREPIVKLWGPSIYSQYTKDKVLKTGDDTWRERLPIELDSAITQALKGILI